MTYEIFLSSHTRTIATLFRDLIVNPMEELIKNLVQYRENLENIGVD